MARNQIMSTKMYDIAEFQPNSCEKVLFPMPRGSSTHLPKLIDCKQSSYFLFPKCQYPKLPIQYSNFGYQWKYLVNLREWYRYRFDRSQPRCELLIGADALLCKWTSATSWTPRVLSSAISKSKCRTDRPGRPSLWKWCVWFAARVSGDSVGRI